MKFSALKYVAAASALVALGLGSTAANASASASANATATITGSLTLSNSRDLAFGSIIPGSAAANVVVNSAGVATCGTGLTCSGTTSSAAFALTGNSNSVIAITVPASVVLVGAANVAHTMTATLSGPTSVTLSSTGAGAFNVGGSLPVASGQAPDSYSGTFSVTAEYN